MCEKKMKERRCGTFLREYTYLQVYRYVCESRRRDSCTFRAAISLSRLSARVNLPSRATMIRIKSSIQERIVDGVTFKKIASNRRACIGNVLPTRVRRSDMRYVQSKERRRRDCRASVRAEYDTCGSLIRNAPSNSLEHVKFIKRKLYRDLFAFFHYIYICPCEPELLMSNRV